MYQGDGHTAIIYNDYFCRDQIINRVINKNPCDMICYYTDFPESSFNFTDENLSVQRFTPSELFAHQEHDILQSYMKNVLYIIEPDKNTADGSLNRLAKTCRHYNITLIIVTQTALAIHPSTRHSISFVLKSKHCGTTINNKVRDAFVNAEIMSVDL